MQSASVRPVLRDRARPYAAVGASRAPSAPAPSSEETGEAERSGRSAPPAPRPPRGGPRIDEIARRAVSEEDGRPGLGPPAPEPRAGASPRAGPRARRRRRQAVARARGPAAGDPLRRTPYPYRPQIGRGDPLNLSISLSGGKETNQDSLSSGERRGKSPAPNPRPRGRGKCGVRKSAPRPAPRGGPSPFERGPAEGERPVAAPGAPERGLPGVGLLGNAAQSGW